MESPRIFPFVVTPYDRVHAFQIKVFSPESHAFSARFYYDDVQSLADRMYCAANPDSLWIQNYIAPHVLGMFDAETKRRIVDYIHKRDCGNYEHFSPATLRFEELMEYIEFFERNKGAHLHQMPIWCLCLGFEVAMSEGKEETTNMKQLLSESDYARWLKRWGPNPQPRNDQDALVYRMFEHTTQISIIQTQLSYYESLFPVDLLSNRKAAKDIQDEMDRIRRATDSLRDICTRLASS